MLKHQVGPVSPGFLSLLSLDACVQSYSRYPNEFSVILWGRSEITYHAGDQQTWDSERLLWLQREANSSSEPPSDTGGPRILPKLR